MHQPVSLWHHLVRAMHQRDYFQKACCLLLVRPAFARLATPHTTFISAAISFVTHVTIDISTLSTHHLCPIQAAASMPLSNCVSRGGKSDGSTSDIPAIRSSSQTRARGTKPFGIPIVPRLQYTSSAPSRNMPEAGVMQIGAAMRACLQNVCGGDSNGLQRRARLAIFPMRFQPISCAIIEQVRHTKKLG